jgi:hypothetical protein
MLTLARMRLAILGVGVQLLLVTSAYAGRSGGSTGGGRLGQVSGGISRATSSSSGGNGGGDRTVRDHRSDSRDRGWYREEWRDCPTDVMPNDFGRNPPPSTRRSSNWCNGRYIAVLDVDGNVVREYQPSPPLFYGGTANVDGFVGLHKVVESNSALSASLAIDDRWLRIAGTLTRYQEHQMDGSELTLTVPTLTAGLRISGGGATRVYLEGGVAAVKTHNEPMGDSSITGTKLGLHGVHRFGGTGHPALVVDAHVLYFSDANIRALAARVGVRVSFLEVALRVLDFNVGPALYGPEVGLQF